MTDSAEAESIRSAIKDLELDYMRGLISAEELSRGTSELRAKLAEIEDISMDYATTSVVSSPSSRWKRRGTGLIAAVGRAMKSWLPVRYIRQHSLLILMILINILVRIPRVPHLQGYDGFVLTMESFSLLDGYAVTWLIHPASYFGMFSFSGYPIGSVALLALFLAITHSLETATFLFLVFFSILSVPTSYLLMKNFFEEERIRLIGVAFYTLMPITYDFTYNTATSRAPFLALLPLCILALLKWGNANGKFISFVESVVLILIMMLFHRMAIVLGVFLVIATLYKFLRALLRRTWTPGEALLINRFLSLIFLSAAVIIFPAAILISGFSPKHLLPEELFPEWSLPFAQGLIGISIDYLLFFGLGLILLVYAVYHIVRGIWTSTTLVFDGWNDWALLLLFALPLVFFIPNPAYTRHFLSPLAACFAAYGTKILIEKKGRAFLAISTLMVVPLIAFFQAYNLFWRDIEPYATSSTIILLLLFFVWLFAESLYEFFTAKPYIFGYHEASRNLSVAILFTILLVFTVATTDMATVSDMDGREISRHVTAEEVAIAGFIKEQHQHYTDRSVLLCSHELIEIRIAAYAETTSLNEGLGTTLMEVGYLTREDALSNSSLNLFGRVFEPHWFEHNNETLNVPQRFWFAIMLGNYSSSQTQELLRTFHIRFFVGLRGNNESLGPWFGTFESPFRISLTAPIVYETANFIVYKLD
ncbi:MAG: hypothetical protein ACFFER_09525 [Candidatus Thorarchaeota archaeon]